MAIRDGRRSGRPLKWVRHDSVHFRRAEPGLRVDGAAKCRGPYAPRCRDEGSRQWVPCEAGEGQLSTRATIVRHSLLAFAAVGGLAIGLGCGDGEGAPSTLNVPSSPGRAAVPLPTATVPVPTGLKVSAAGSSFVEFEWSRVEDATRYEIELSLVDGDFASATSRLVFDGVTRQRFDVGPETTSYARVRAEVSGRWSDYSASVEGRSLPRPPLGSCGEGARHLLIEEIGPGLLGGARFGGWRHGTDMGTWSYVTVDDDQCVTRLDFRGDTLYGLYGGIPASIGRLRRLRELYLGADWETLLNSSEFSETYGGYQSPRSALGGEIPAELGQLAELRILYIHGHEITGRIPEELGQLTELRELGITGTSVSGPIPAELGQLTSLRTLAITAPVTSYVRGKGFITAGRLTGAIPAEIANLTELESLALVGSGLEGPILADIVRNLTRLETLIVSGNDLGESIPSEIGDLTRLRYLVLAKNNLRGSLPSRIGNLTNLEYLAVDGNALGGPIPSELGYLGRLEKLYMFGNNLTGEIPWTLSRNSSLFRLDLTDNRLSGCIPVGLPQVGVNDGHSVNPQKNGIRLDPCEVGTQRQ